MKKGIYNKSLCLVIVGLILVLAVPSVQSRGYSYSKEYDHETYTYTDDVDYEYSSYNYEKYVEYDYSTAYYSYYGSYEYGKYYYVYYFYQNFLYNMFERFPCLEKLFDRFF